jgi:Rod binding domain-containing protein
MSATPIGDRTWSLERLTETPASADERRERAEAVASRFEQLFVQHFVSGLRKTTAIGESEGLFGNGPGSDTYTQWFDEHFASHVMNNGGLGVRDVLLRDWERIGQIPPANAREAIDVQA